MAPEQIRGKPRPASDQYALGMMVYEWLCGKPAFQGEPFAVMYQQTSEPVPPLREHVPTVPPAGVLAQATWIYTHRRARLTGMVGLLVVAGLMGGGEGIARRRTDVLGGFLLRWWTAGVVGLALIPGAIAGYLLAPWPLPGVVAASGLALLVALILYGLCAGRPYIP